MKIHELELTAHTQPKRIGRGIGSGKGKTAGRGTKGQNARTGGGVRPGFEGGQNPLSKRLPKKRGFVPINKTTYQPINIEALKDFKKDAVIDNAALYKTGLIKHENDRVKLLSSGEITHALKIKVQAVSKTAQTKIEKAGGTIELTVLPKPAKLATRPTTDKKATTK
jgi:large subunit ribosomal protein L15